MERSLPQKAPIRLQVHTKERILLTREVIVVYTGVNKGRWKVDLPDVVLHGELGAPLRKTWPSFPKDTVIGHAAVDIMNNPRFLGRIR